MPYYTVMCDRNVTQRWNVLKFIRLYGTER
nr:MAG TPA: hypothetical protein [Caudoviricetes sp.]